MVPHPYAPAWLQHLRGLGVWMTHVLCQNCLLRDHWSLNFFGPSKSRGTLFPGHHTSLCSIIRSGYTFSSGLRSGWNVKVFLPGSTISGDKLGAFTLSNVREIGIPRSILCQFSLMAALRFHKESPARRDALSLWNLKIKDGFTKIHYLCGIWRSQMVFTKIHHLWRIQRSQIAFHVDSRWSSSSWILFISLLETHIFL